MKTATLWCTVSATEYDLLAKTLAASANSPFVAAVVVVVTSRAAPSNFGSLARADSRYQEVHRDFGSGFDSALEEGGYDQIAARNFALELAEERHTDWLAQIDADEVYETALFRKLQVLPTVCNVVTTSRFTLVGRDRYWCGKKTERLIAGTTMVNPHTLIWKPALKLRFEKSPNVERYFINHSRHCGVRFDHNPDCNGIIISEPYHFHLHCLLGKRHTDRFSTHSRPLHFPLPPTTEALLKNLFLDTRESIEGGYKFV